jgi:transposase-like protein
MVTFRELPYQLMRVLGRVSELSLRPVQAVDRAPPLQRQIRLGPEARAQLATDYLSGAPVAELCARFQVHRTTVLAVLAAADAVRPPYVRKLTDADVDVAARLYLAGSSLATVARQFEVDPSTIRKELIRAGVAIRPRNGWAQRPSWS